MLQSSDMNLDIAVNGLNGVLQFIKIIEIPDFVLQLFIRKRLQLLQELILYLKGSKFKK